MAITPGTLSVPDFASVEQKLKTLDDTADGTKSPAHPLLSSTGSIINPATADLQVTANTALGTIATAGATAAHQVEHNTKLDAIATNTAVGSVNFSVTPTVTAGTYTAGMVVGGKIAVTGAARANGGSGWIQQAAVCKRTTLTAPFDLLVFHTDPTASFVDHALLPDISGDFAKYAGRIQCTDIVDCLTPQILQAFQQAVQFQCAPGSTAIYVVPVIRASETYASTNAVTINLGIPRD